MSSPPRGAGSERLTITRRARVARAPTASAWCAACGGISSEAERPPAYSRDWAETGGRETMPEAASRHLVAISSESLAPGDVAIFRLRTGAVAKHAAVIASRTTMIHAMEGVPVSEVTLSPWWRRRIVGAFRFPHLAEA